MGVIEDRARSRPRRATAAVALGAALAHARTVGFGFTDLDDRDLIVDDHAFLARPANLVRLFGRAYMHVVDPGHAYYRPLVTASYALDAQWSGVRPWGYHLTNVALYAVATALFATLLRRLSMPPAVAIAGAAVFAVHPALAEAVAWIPGRNDALLAVFELGAWLAFLEDRARPRPPSRPSSLRRRALHFALFGAALLTKETAVALPLLWTAQAALLGPRPRLREAMVYVGGWAASIATRLWLAPGSGTTGGLDALTLVRAWPIAIASVGKAVLPFAPTVLSVPEDLSLWPGVLATIGIAGAVWTVPGVRRPVVVFGAAAFALTLAPVLALPGTLVLDSRLVLPACGLLVAVAEIARAAVFGRGDLSDPVERDSGEAGKSEPQEQPPREPALFVALSAVLVLVLLAVTTGYEGAFRDPRAFAREAVADSPHSALAHFSLGQAYQIAGDDERALAEYQTSLALAPGEVVHNNIAVIAMKAARWPEAERELRQELALGPRYARAYANLAIVLHHEARDEEAQQAEQTAKALEGTE
jgi:hypothetical protein